MLVPRTKPAPTTPLDENHYRDYFVATVRFEDGKMVVEGGKGDLTRAKSKTDTCYVKDTVNQKSVKLILIDKKWTIA